MVLFVFVIMLLNAGEEERTRGSRIALLVGVPGVFVLAVLPSACSMKRQLRLGGVSRRLHQLWRDATRIAHLLFHNFLLPFEVTSVLILIAIMGAVVLARKEN